MLKCPTVNIFTRNVSFNMFKRWGNKCEKDECKNTAPPSKYVVEKSCRPSIFQTWKPKKPNLNAYNYPTIQKNMMAQYQPKICTSSMKFREKSRCEIEAAAKERQKKNHPKWLQFCPPIPKNQVSKGDAAQPPLRSVLASCGNCKGTKGQIQKQTTAKCLKKKCDPKVPEGDWNPDGQLSG